jgi:predicted house-cleaning noncanonical NTP pyrophosphatase (MazG superfamily)
VNIKLIRDRMGIDIGLGPGDSVSICANPAEYRMLLLEKFDEESEEFRKELIRREPNVERLKEEMSDLYEVMRSLAEQFGNCTMKDVEEVAAKKRAIRGGFTAGIVLHRRNPK